MTSRYALDGDAARFVSVVRGIDVSGRSDAELREAADGLRESEPAGGGRSTALCFALLCEAIERRLGLWRLFDAGFRQSAAVRLQLSEWELLGGDAALAESIAAVERQTSNRYASQVDLPSEFYRAARASPVGGMLRFAPTDEQLEAGRLLLGRVVVEMDAGEGKTIAGAFPAFAHALAGRNVHVMTANDYLALRDAELLAPAYESLGLTVAALQSAAGPAERRSGYRCDIVYGQLREFGFDFLRDNLRLSRDDAAQRALDVAIVDEADHALIDDGRTPLIIAGEHEQGAGQTIHRVKTAVERVVAEQRLEIEQLASQLSSSDAPDSDERWAALYLADPGNPAVIAAAARDERWLPRVHATIAERLEEDVEPALARRLLYTIDIARDHVSFTERGRRTIEAALGPVYDTDTLYANLAEIDLDLDTPLASRRRRREAALRRISRRYGLANQAQQTLRAYALLARNEDYVVANGRVVLVDDLTGRRREGNRYQHGLQSAIEAKEGVTAHPDPRALAYLTVEGFARRYRRVSGMTGTAVEARDAFRRAYALDVVRVEPGAPSRRVDRPPRFLPTRREKVLSIVEEVSVWHSVGRPTLIGARTVEQSEEICRLLQESGLPFNRLDAVANDDEARVVREAGAFGAITVATNMAGRGTDILLDDDLDARVTERFASALRERLDAHRGAIRVDCVREDVADLLRARLEYMGLSCDGGGAEVVVGAGEVVGEAEFGLGLHVIGSEMNEAARIDRQLRGRGGRQGRHGSSRFTLSLEDAPIVAARRWRLPASSGDAQRLAQGVQASIEREAEAAREASRDIHRVIERQTLNYYAARNRIMERREFGAACRELAPGAARRFVDALMPDSFPTRYARRFDDLCEGARLDFGLDIGDMFGLGRDALREALSDALRERFLALAGAVGEERYDRLARTLMLQVGDRRWTRHLDTLQDMALSAQLSAMGYARAIADLALRAEAEYQAFGERVEDEFVTRLSVFDPGERADDARSVALVPDIEAILL